MYGATYVLKRSVKKVLFEDGKVVGVVDSEGKTIKCAQLIANPEHLSNLVSRSNLYLALFIVDI